MQVIPLLDGGKRNERFAPGLGRSHVSHSFVFVLFVVAGPPTRAGTLSAPARLRGTWPLSCCGVLASATRGRGPLAHSSRSHIMCHGTAQDSNYIVHSIVHQSSMPCVHVIASHTHTEPHINIFRPEV